MELLSLDKDEIFIKKFNHFSAMLFHNCARLWNNSIFTKQFLQSFFQFRFRGILARKETVKELQCLIQTLWRININK